MKMLVSGNVNQHFFCEVLVKKRGNITEKSKYLFICVVAYKILNLQHFLNYELSRNRLSIGFCVLTVLNLAGNRS